MSTGPQQAAAGAVATTRPAAPTRALAPTRERSGS